MGELELMRGLFTLICACVFIALAAVPAAASSPKNFNIPVGSALGPGQSADAATQGPTTIIVQAGHSFAAGVYTGVTTPSPIDQINNPNITAYGNIACTGVPVFGLYTYRPGQDACGNATDFAWEASLARQLEANGPNQKYVIVRAGVFGTTLAAVMPGDGNPTSDWSNNPTSGTLVPSTAVSITGAKAAIIARGETVGPIIAYVTLGENDAKATNPTMTANWSANEATFYNTITGSGPNSWGAGKVYFHRTQINSHWPLANLLRPQQMAEALALGAQAIDIDSVEIDSTGHPDPTGDTQFGTQFVSRTLLRDNLVAPILSSTSYSATLQAQGQDYAAFATPVLTNSPQPTANFAITNTFGGLFAVNSETGTDFAPSGFNIVYNPGGVNTYALTHYVSNGVGTTAYTINLTVTAPAAPTDVSGTVMRGEPANGSFSTVATGSLLTANTLTAGTTCTGSSTVNVTGNSGTGGQINYAAAAGVNVANINAAGSGYTAAAGLTVPASSNCTGGTNATASIGSIGSTQTTLTDVEGSGRTLAPSATSRKPQVLAAPSAVNVSDYFSPQGGLQATLIGTASTSYASTSTTQFGMGMAYMMTANTLATTLISLNFGSTTPSLDVICEPTGFLSVSAPLAINGALSISTTTAPCLPNVHYAIWVQFNGAVGTPYVTLYEQQDGGSPLAYTASNFSGALRSTILPSSATGGGIPLIGSTAALGSPATPFYGTEFVFAPVLAPASDVTFSLTRALAALR